MVIHEMSLEVSLHITTRNDVTEQQIRGYLANYRGQGESKLAQLVLGAPVQASTSLVSTDWQLDVSDVGGIWEIELGLTAFIETAESITEKQVHIYLADFFDQAKAYVRALLDNAPNKAKVVIQDWHIHRDGAGGHEDEE